MFTAALENSFGAENPRLETRNRKRLGGSEWHQKVRVLSNACKLMRVEKARLNKIIFNVHLVNRSAAFFIPIASSVDKKFPNKNR